MKCYLKVFAILHQKHTTVQKQITTSQIPKTLHWLGLGLFTLSQVQLYVCITPNDYLSGFYYGIRQINSTQLNSIQPGSSHFFNLNSQMLQMQWLATTIKSAYIYYSREKQQQNTRILKVKQSQYHRNSVFHVVTIQWRPCYFCYT